jgi:hypothetical protein
MSVPVPRLPAAPPEEANNCAAAGLETAEPMFSFLGRRGSSRRSGRPHQRTRENGRNRKPRHGDSDTAVRDALPGTTYLPPGCAYPSRHECRQHFSAAGGQTKGGAIIKLHAVAVPPKTGASKMCRVRTRTATIGVTALAVVALIGPACKKGSQSPAEPTPIPVYLLTMYVHEGAAARSSLYGPSLPIPVRYYSCLSIVTAATTTYTQEMTVFGPSGEAYATTPGIPVPGTETGPAVGCGYPYVTDTDLTHPFAVKYRVKLTYQVPDGRSGVVEGEGPMGPVVATTPEPVGVVIYRFRTRGPSGEGDEFVELANQSAQPVTMERWYINVSDGNGILHKGISIPTVTLGPGCHYLLTATAYEQRYGYSGTVPGDASMSAFTIPDDGSLGMGMVIPPGVVDQVALSWGALYREGTPLASFSPVNTDRAYVRVGPDTDDNSRDFVMESPSHPQNLSACSSGLDSPSRSPVSK